MDWRITSWDDIGRNMEGSFLHRMAETGKALGGLVTAPVGLVYDVSRMVNGYDGEWNDIKKDLGAGASALAAPFTLLLDPLTPVFEQLYKPYKYGVSPALSTVGLATQKLNPFVDGKGDQMDWDLTSWEGIKDVYGEARNVSPGQAMVPAMHVPGLDYLTWNPFGLWTNDWGALFTGEWERFALSQARAFRPWTKEDLEILDKQNSGISWNLVTGLSDAAATWFLDPTIIGGKYLAGVRAAKRANVPALMSSKKVEKSLGVKPTSEGDLVDLVAADRFVDWTAAEIQRNPIEAEIKFFQAFGGKKNNQSRALAALLRDAGEREGPDGIRTMLKVSLGDEATIQFLKTERTDLWYSIGQAEDKVSLLREVLNSSSPSAQQIAAASAFAPGAVTTAGVIDQPLLKNVIDDLEKNVLPDYRAHDNYLDRLVGDINRPIDEVGDAASGIQYAASRNVPFTADRGKNSFTEKNIRKSDRYLKRQQWDPRVNLVDRAFGNKEMKPGPIPMPTTSPLVTSTTYYPKGIFGVPVRAYRVARRSLEDARPQGYMDLNDSNQAAEEVHRFLSRVKGMRTEEIQYWAGEAVRARGEGALGNVALKVQEAAIQNAARRYGINDPEVAQALAYSAMEQKNAAWREFKNAGEAEFAVLEGNQKRIVHRIAKDDGIAENLPYNLKQLKNTEALIDIDTVQKAFARHQNILRRIGGSKVADPALLVGDMSAGLWKSNVLLRGIGFPIKVLADDGARSWAVLDSLAHYSNPKSFGRAFRSGTVEGAKRFPSTFRDWWRGQSFHPTELPARFRSVRNKEPFERFPRGSVLEQNWEHQGQSFEGLLGGKDTDLLRSLFSGRWEAMNTRSRDVLNDMRIKMGGRRVTPQDEGEHLRAWRDNGNFQLGSDPITSRLIRGQHEDAVTAWFKREHGLRKRNADLGRNPRAAVQRAKALVDQYFPPHILDNVTADGRTIRQKLLAKELDVEDLRAIPMADRPPVHDIDMQLNLINGSLSQMMGKTLNKVYDTILNAPHSAMVRHPLANTLYQSRVKELADAKIRQLGRPLNVQEINQIQNSSRRFAQHQVGQIVMDMASMSSAGHALRFVAPFFDAWRESLVKWSKIFYEDPTRLYRIMEYRNSWGNTFDLQTAEGQKIDIKNPVYTEGPNKGKTVPVGDQKFVLRLAPSLAKKIPGLEVMSQLDIPRGATDFVFQGQRWYQPDFGPFVKVPASKLLENKPDLEGIFKDAGVMPDGAVDVETLIIGSTYRNALKAMLAPEGDKAFMQTMLYMALSDQDQYLNGTRKPPDWDEIKSKARFHWGIKFLAGLAAPVSTQFKPKNQFMIDEYRRLLADESVGPENADRVFYEKYPEYFHWAATMSKNNAHLPASKRAMKVTRQNMGLITKHPDMAAVIVGNVEGSNDFSPSVYQWQMNNLMGSGTGKTFRQFQSARDAFEAVQAREGWLKWQKYNDQLQATLNSRGYVDFEDPGAEDLAAMKRQFTETLAGENPVWAEDFFTKNTRQVPQWIEAARDITSDKKLMRNDLRQDLRGLTQYIQVRDEFLAELKRRKEEGGSGDLTATSNLDLYQEWRITVGQLKEANTMFSTLYQRYLEHDTIQEGTFGSPSARGTNELLGTV